MFSDNPVVNFDKFLGAISDEKPCGDPFDDDQFFVVLDTSIGRIEDEIKKESGVSDDLRKSIEEYLKTIEAAFQKSSKSLRLLGFYLQLIFWKYQFSGLRDGLELFKRLATQYWSQVHPADFEDRYKVLKNMTPIFVDDDMPLFVLNRIKLDVDGEFTVIDLLKSESVANVDLDNKYFKRIHVDTNNQTYFVEVIENFDRILQTAAEIDEMFVEQLTADREAASQAIASQGAEGEEPLSADDIQSKIQAFEFNTEINRGYWGILDEDFVAKLTKIRRVIIDKVRVHQADFMMDDQEEETEEDGATGGGGGGVNMSGAIDSRATALHFLEKVAQYFKANEPHSPIPYALMEIREWGSLQFPDLMQRLGHRMADNEDTFKVISKRLNFTWPEPPDDD